MKYLFTALFLVSFLSYGSAQEAPYSSNEMVLFTLVDKNLRYEIRLYQEKSIKTYEVKDGEFTYLGKFLNLAELERSEPYKSLMANARKLTKTLVTDGYLGNEFYEIYIHNLFNPQERSPVFVEVLKVNEDTTEIISKYEKEVDFNNSPYAPLIYRD